MMTQAYYTGISGLQNSSNAINVVSDNIANVNTVGFRGEGTEFASLFENSITTGKGDTSTVGVGVRLQATPMMKNQGALKLSENSTDVAIHGDGWFGIQGKGTSEYTRNGAFTFDKNSDLVTADGYHVLGTMGGNIADGVLTEKLTKIPLSDVKGQKKLNFPKTLSYPTKPSSKAKFLANLGVGNDPITIGATVIDSKSNRNNLHLEFVKKKVQTPPGSQYTVTAKTQNPEGTKIYDTKTGDVTFDAAGALVSNSLKSIDNNGTPVTIDLGSGYDGVTSIDVPVVSGSSIADGIVGGDLIGYSMNKNAEIVATFTNGEQSSVGKIALYHFINEQGLDRISGTRFAQSGNSGDPLFRKDAEGKNVNGSDVLTHRLENSNVELSHGLTDLIIFQRAFDANSKSIKTADEMMQKALSMGA